MRSNVISSTDAILVLLHPYTWSSMSFTSIVPAGLAFFLKPIPVTFHAGECKADLANTGCKDGMFRDGGEILDTSLMEHDIAGAKESPPKDYNRDFVESFACLS
jgi:hypothetical protein